MKNILILRHAKSDWLPDTKSDFERPLTSRGKNDAPKIGKAILDKEIVPDHILSSPAKRAVETIEAVAKACNYKHEIEFVNDFYMSSINTIFEHIKNLNNSIDRVLLVGHNPIWELLSMILIKNNIEIEMTTANLISIDLPIDNWKDISNRQGKFNWQLKPKQL